MSNDRPDPCPNDPFRHIVRIAELAGAGTPIAVLGRIDNDHPLGAETLSLLARATEANAFGLSKPDRARSKAAGLLLPDAVPPTSQRRGCRDAAACTFPAAFIGLAIRTVARFTRRGNP
jgi:hypothetical protein